MADKEQIINNFDKDIDVPCKEPIIIDGVDVSGCKYLGKGRICNAEREEDGYTDWACCNPELNDCYFKQLARKTQECENLKEDYEEVEQRHNGVFQDFKRLNQECEELRDARFNLNCEIYSLNRYRKALKEIEKFIQEEDWSILDYVYKGIKDIINKAKGENNGINDNSK